MPSSMRRLGWLAVVLVCLPFVEPASAQQYGLEYYGRERGLTNLVASALFQDRAGFLWVGTEDGLFRFDGDKFQRYPRGEGWSIGDRVSLGEAPDGSLLVGGRFGLYRLTKGRFERLPLPPGVQSVSVLDGIAWDGRERTYLGTDVGLVIATGNPKNNSLRMQLVKTPSEGAAAKERVAGLFADHDTVWFGCGNSVCHLQGDQTEIFGTEIFGKDAGLPVAPWSCIRKTKDGNLWVHAQNTPLFVMRPGSKRFTSVAGTETALTSFEVDSNGRVLLRTTEGMIILDAGKLQRIGRSSGLHNTLYSVLQDREGSLWLTPQGHGVARWLGYSEWEAFTADSGLENESVWGIAPAGDGTIWVGTEGGLYRGSKSGGSKSGSSKSGKAWSWKKQAALGSTSLVSVKRDGAGGLWLSTQTKGVARLNLATGTVQWFAERQGLDIAGNSGVTLFIDRNQRIWAGTETGLFVASLSTRKFHRVPELSRLRCWAIAQGPDGDIWVGTSGEGLFRLSGGKWHALTTADGLKDKEIPSLAVSRTGDVWVGYPQGGFISRIHREGEHYRMTHYGRPQGIIAQVIYALHFDAFDRLWAGTDQGVLVWNGTGWTHYDHNDGLVWDDCNADGFAAEPDGTVWIGTSGGVSRFSPGPDLGHKVLFQPIYTRIRLGNSDIDPAAGATVGFDSNRLLVKFSVLSFRHEHAMSYRYRLSPLVQDWIETSQRELQLPGLPPNSYALEVEAREEGGQWGPPAGVAFEIRPPWWRTWWFRTLIAISIAALLFRLHAWRLAALRRRERQLISLVDERTVELREANGELLRLSSLDGLTGVANRRVFDETLRKEWSRMSRGGTAISVLMLDIDHFKLLNDSMGHQYGDECLKLVARELSKSARRSTDLVARYGGEEFAVILPGTDALPAEKMGQRICSAVADLNFPHSASPIAQFVTVSIGIASSSDGKFREPTELLAAADAALYRAKRQGRNRAATYDPGALAEHDQCQHTCPS